MRRRIVGWMDRMSPDLTRRLKSYAKRGRASA
jgi:hypothetical protein